MPSGYPVEDPGHTKGPLLEGPWLVPRLQSAGEAHPAAMPRDRGGARAAEQQGGGGGTAGADRRRAEIEAVVDRAGDGGRRGVRAGPRRLARIRAALARNCSDGTALAAGAAIAPIASAPTIAELRRRLDLGMVPPRGESMTRQASIKN